MGTKDLCGLFLYCFRILSGLFSWSNRWDIEHLLFHFFSSTTITLCGGLISEKIPGPNSCRGGFESRPPQCQSCPFTTTPRCSDHLDHKMGTMSNRLSLWSASQKQSSAIILFILKWQSREAVKERERRAFGPMILYGPKRTHRMILATGYSLLKSRSVKIDTYIFPFLI